MYFITAVLLKQLTNTCMFKFIHIVIHLVTREVLTRRADVGPTSFLAAGNMWAIRKYHNVCRLSFISFTTCQVYYICASSETASVHNAPAK